MRRISFLPRKGGKYELIEHIKLIIEACLENYDCTIFAELCGGGGKIVLNVGDSTFEEKIYNEINFGICNIFKVLQDYDIMCEFIEEVEAIEHCKEEFNIAKMAIEEEDEIYRQYGKHSLSIMQSAVYSYILAHYSRSADMVSYTPSGIERSLRKKLLDLKDIYDILKETEVQNKDCMELLKEYKDNEKMLIYLDPPYIPSTMSCPETYGKHSWSLEQHQKLVQVLLTSQAKVILSGYDDGITYKVLEDQGWQKVFFKKQNVRSSGNGRRAGEFVWCSFEVCEYTRESIAKLNL